RILVNRQMRPRTGRSFQVRLQHGSTLVRGNLLQSHLLTTPVKKSCDVCTPVVKANPGSRVQSLIFDKDKYKDAKEAKAWANDHGFDAGKVDETSDSFRIRQEDPDHFARIRTISLTTGVKATVGFPRSALKALHGSQRAGLPHWALASGDDAK